MKKAKEEPRKRVGIIFTGFLVAWNYLVSSHFLYHNVKNGGSFLPPYLYFDSVYSVLSKLQTIYHMKMLCIESFYIGIGL